MLRRSRPRFRPGTGPGPGVRARARSPHRSDPDLPSSHRWRSPQRAGREGPSPPRRSGSRHRCAASGTPLAGPARVGRAAAAFLLVGLAVACGDDGPASPDVRTGACCYPDSCVVVPEEICAGEGSYQGDGVACEPGTCPPPPGGCCLQGRCTVREAAECLALGGNYYGDGISCEGYSRSAGPNSGGTLLLHYAANVDWTSASDTLPPISSCEEIVSFGPGDGSTAVVYAFAVFPEFDQPRVQGVLFGIRHDAVIVESGSLADFELATQHWPDSGSGIGLAWNSVRTGRHLPVYWFATYAEEGTEIEIVPHPNQDAAGFADDSVPTVLDEATGLGQLGFGSGRGRRVCSPCR